MVKICYIFQKRTKKTKTKTKIVQFLNFFNVCDGGLSNCKKFSFVCNMFDV